MASWKKILTAIPAMSDLAASPANTKFLRGDGSWQTPPSGSDTTYSTSWVDSGTNAILRLTAGGDGSGDDDLTIVAGTGITVTPSSDNLTIASTISNSDTTYSVSAEDGDNADEEKIVLTAGGSGSGTDAVVLEAGTGLSVARSGDKITFTNTVSDSGNTQNTYTSSWVDDSNDALLRLTAGGASSGTQDIKVVAGTGITVTPSGSNLTIASSITQTTNTDVNVNVTNLTARLPQITESVTIGDATDVTVTTSGDLVVTGDLTVSGDTTTLNTATLLVEDKIIEVATGSGGGSASGADQSGIQINTGNSTQEPMIQWTNATGFRQWSLKYDGDTTNLPIQTVQLEADSGAPSGQDSIAGGLCYNSADGELYFYDAS